MSVLAGPVVDGIPYLRSGRDALLERVHTALDSGDVDTARLELLCDRDDWAPGDPPSLDDAAAAVAAKTLRGAMEALGYGPVADYFSFRRSDPTFLSGQALLAMHPQRPLFELGCGIGLFLRPGDTGADVVWSKLWLARRFVAPEAALLCFDARDPFPVVDASAAVAFCHDALYFLPEKDHVARELARIAPTVIVGHAHNARVESPSHGDPLTPEAYAELLDDPVLYDDAELTRACLEDRVPRPGGTERAAAVALVAGGGEPRRAGALPAPGVALRRNPLLRGDGTVGWPSERYEQEYAPLSPYLTDPPPDAGDFRERVRRRLLVPEDRAAVRFGLVGCGWVARDFVAPALALSQRAELACTYDPAAALPGVPSHASLAELVDDPGVDAVYVATPNDVHSEAVAAAAAAGKAVLCEKPMAASLAGAREIAAAVRAAGVPYATAFDQRHHPAHERLGELIAAGDLGTVTAVRIVYACWVGPEWAADNWRADAARAGGGALMDLAPHGLDLVTALTGDELDEVAALRQRRVHPYPVDDGAVLCARTRGGVLATLHVAYNHPEHLPRRRLEVIGTGGLAVATDTMGQDPGGTLTLDGAPVDFDRAQSPFARQLDAFAAAVLGGADTAAGLERDLRLMELLEPCR